MCAMRRPPLDTRTCEVSQRRRHGPSQRVPLGDAGVAEIELQHPLPAARLGAAAGGGLLAHLLMCACTGTGGEIRQRSARGGTRSSAGAVPPSAPAPPAHAHLPRAAAKHALAAALDAGPAVGAWVGGGLPGGQDVAARGGQARLELQQRGLVARQHGGRRRRQRREHQRCCRQQPHQSSAARWRGL